MQPPEIIKKLRKEIKMGQMSWLSHLIEHNKKEELEVFLAEKGFKDPKFAAKQFFQAGKELDKYKIWQIREAVDIAVGDDGNKSKEVIEILKTEKWDKYATIV